MEAQEEPFTPRPAGCSLEPIPLVGGSGRGHSRAGLLANSNRKQGQAKIGPQRRLSLRPRQALLGLRLLSLQCETLGVLPYTCSSWQPGGSDARSQT